MAMQEVLDVAARITPDEPPVAQDQECTRDIASTLMANATTILEAAPTLGDPQQGSVNRVNFLLVRLAEVAR